MKGFKAQILCLVLAVYLALFSAISLASVDLDAFFGSLKTAAESGDFSSYLGLTYSRNERVKNIVFNPEKLDGAQVTLHLLFDDKGTLVAFSLNDGKAISLDAEGKALFSIYKDHSELIREFFKSPTPQLRKEFEKLVEPVVEGVSDKIEGELKTKFGRFVYKSTQDVGTLSKSALNGLATTTLVSSQFVLRLLDNFNVIVLGGYIIVQILAYPLYGAIFGIPPMDLVYGLKYAALWVGGPWVVRKTISYLLRLGIRITGQKILEIKRANNQPTDGVDLSRVDDNIDTVDTGGDCKTRLGAIMKFIFR